MIDDSGPELLEAAHDVVVVDPPEEARIVAAIGDCNAAIVRGPARLTSKCLEAGELLEVVSASGAGLDSIDVSTATELGIPVLYAPGVGAPSVVEFTLGALVACGRRFDFLNEACRQPDLDWSRRITDLAGIELRDRTLGVVGLGHIGQQVARRAAAAFDMEVVGYDPYLSADHRLGGVRMENSLGELLRKSDFVSLHVALTDETHHLIGPAEFTAMKAGTHLINTSRGSVVDEASLADALRSGKVRSAVIDCFASEPRAADSPLTDAPNVTMTPHVAGLTDRSLRDLAVSVAQGVVTALSGERPPFMANPDVWERRRTGMPRRMEVN
jgi:phosphoglycerate dehydrogenase-like enzyme